jgi:hypothetical protein
MTEPGALPSTTREGASPHRAQRAAHAPHHPLPLALPREECQQSCDRRRAVQTAPPAPAPAPVIAFRYLVTTLWRAVPWVPRRIRLPLLCRCPSAVGESVRRC